jgi:uncharacterized membrane protein
MHSRSLDPGPRFLVRRLRYAQPLEWLQRGWLDLADCPGPGLLYGAAATSLGVLLAWLSQAHFWLMVGAFCACLLLIPLLATRLHALSRALEQGVEPSWVESWATPWSRRDTRPWHLGLLLTSLAGGWAVGCAYVLSRLGGAPVVLSLPLDSLYRVATGGNAWHVEAWLLLGAALAAPIFALSVVAMPMLLDTPASVSRALQTSWLAVWASPGPMALWACTMVLLTLLGAVTLLLGLIIIVPWLAHASWHAYRDLVEADDTATDTALASRFWRSTMRVGHR